MAEGEAHVRLQVDLTDDQRKIVFVRSVQLKKGVWRQNAKEKNVGAKCERVYK